MSVSEAQLRRVAEARVARLATADADGAPHVVPVCFARDGGNLYTAIDRKPKSAPASGLRRVRNIEANPRFALVVDLYREDWDELSYVLVRGSAALVRDEAERLRAIRALRAKYEQYARMLDDRALVIRLTPERTTGWDASARQGQG